MNSQTIARDYDNEYLKGSDTPYYYDSDVLIRRAILRRIEGFLPPKEQLCLEIGGYKGYMTALIGKYFQKIDVVEPVKDFNDELRKVPGINNIFNTPWEYCELDKYACVFLINTLEHMDDRVDALKKVKSHLTDNGILICAVPNAFALSRQIAKAMGIIGELTDVTDSEQLMGHRVTYSLNTLVRDLKAAKLKVNWAGGDIVKPLANFQLDLCIKHEITSEAYFDGLFQLGLEYPTLCASCVAVSTA